MEVAAALALLRRGGRRCASITAQHGVIRVRCIHCGASVVLEGRDGIEPWLEPHDGTC